MNKSRLKYGYLASLVTLLVGCAQQDGEQVSTARQSLASVSVSVNADWDTGYCAQIVVSNPGPTNVDGWSLVVDLKQSSIDQFWSGSYTMSGTEAAIAPLEWNKTLYPGATANLGFCASKTGADYVPTLVSFVDGTAPQGTGGTSGTGGAPSVDTTTVAEGGTTSTEGGAASEGGTPSVDTTTVAEGGTPSVDTTTVAEGGTPSVDTTTVAEGGTPSVDTTTVAEGGTPSVDTTTVAEGGTPSVDTTTVAEGGTPSVDTTTVAEGGTPSVDTTTVAEGGTPSVDTTTVAEGGTPSVDTTTVAEGGTPSVDTTTVAEGGSTGTGGTTSTGGTMNTDAVSVWTLASTLNVNSDWTSGYCTQVDIGNAGPETYDAWSVVLDISTAKIANLWNGVYSQDAGSTEITVTPASYNQTLGAYGNANFGWCSIDVDGVARPKLLSTTVEFKGLGITTATPNDWSTGYCSELEVQNLGDATINDWSLVLDVGSESDVVNLWGASWSMNGSQIISFAADYNKPLAPGEIAELGFCANKTGTMTKYGVGIVTADTVE